MPILIDELLVEAEPPRSPAPPPTNAPAPPSKLPGQADRMLELSVVADRHDRIQVD
jgi:hypothetical protein